MSYTGDKAVLLGLVWLLAEPLQQSTPFALATVSMSLAPTTETILCLSVGDLYCLNLVLEHHCHTFRGLGTSQQTDAALPKAARMTCQDVIDAICITLTRLGNAGDELEKGPSLQRMRRSRRTTGHDRNVGFASVLGVPGGRTFTRIMNE